MITELRREIDKPMHRMELHSMWLRGTAVMTVRADAMTGRPSMLVRLYWTNGRIEDVAGVKAGTTAIVRQTSDGHRHFVTTGEEDEDGVARFIEAADDE